MAQMKKIIVKRKETNQPTKGNTKNSQPTTLNNETPMGPL
jgi:hypothetical protein